MKQILRTLLVGLLLLSAKTVCANSANPAAVAQGTDVSPNQKLENAKKTIQESTAIFTYEEGVLRKSNGGDLYEYPNDNQGDFRFYKAIYYLFTSRQYVHLDDHSQATGNEFIFMMIRNGSGKWVNVYTGKDAAADKKFGMNESGPYRCVAKANNKAEILLSVNSRGEAEKDKTILLVVLPALEKSHFDCFIRQGNNKMPFDVFTDNIKLRTDSEKPLAGYTLIVERSNGLVVDRIIYADSNIMKYYRDTPLKDGVISIPLDDIPVKRNAKELKFCIHYKEFKDGKITPRSSSQTLKLSWDKPTGGRIIWELIIIVGVVLSICWVLIRKARSRRRIIQPSDSNVNDNGDGDVPVKVVSGNKNLGKKGKKNKGDERNNTCSIGNRGQDKVQNEISQNQIVVKIGVENKQENDIPRTVKGNDDHERTIASLKEENVRLAERIEGLEKQIQSEKKKTEEAEQNAKALEAKAAAAEERTDKAEKNAKEKAEKEIKKIEEETNRKVKEAQDSAEAAKVKAREAEKNAKEKAEKEIKKIEEEANRKVKEAQDSAEAAKVKAREAEKTAKEKAEKEVKKIEEEANRKVKEAQDSAEAAKVKADNDIKEAKAEVLRERDEELTKLVGLAKRLKSLLNEIPDDAFGRNGLVLKSGVDSYCNNLDSVVNQNLSLKRSLEEMREYSLVQLGIGSSCWIHCLGRLYSYLSVKALRDQLEYEGVNADTLTEAFRTLVVLLAAQGIVVRNCSLGFDSITDPATNNLFELDMMIDRITNWLGGNARVRKAIPNHGSTIYDFGTLAYYSIENTDIHQGKVMYYDE